MTSMQYYKLAQHYDKRHRQYAKLSRERGLTLQEARDYHEVWRKRQRFLRLSGRKFVIQI